MTERVIPVMSQNEDFRKRQKKKRIRGHVCVNVTCLVYCMTAHLTMTASLIITLGDKDVVHSNKFYREGLCEELLLNDNSP